MTKVKNINRKSIRLAVYKKVLHYLEKDRGYGSLNEYSGLCLWLGTVWTGVDHFMNSWFDHRDNLFEWHQVAGYFPEFGNYYRTKAGNVRTTYQYNVKYRIKILRKIIADMSKPKES